MRQAKGSTPGEVQCEHIHVNVHFRWILAGKMLTKCINKFLKSDGRAGLKEVELAITSTTSRSPDVIGLQKFFVRKCGEGDRNSYISWLTDKDYYEQKISPHQGSHHKIVLSQFVVVWGRCSGERRLTRQAGRDSAPSPRNSIAIAVEIICHLRAKLSSRRPSQTQAEIEEKRQHL